MTGKNILIVDDEGEMRLLIKLCLSQENYTTLEANNGLEALNVIRENDIHLVLLDIMMPEIDGFELLKALREELDKRIPVILISALGDTDRVVKGLHLGADDYIVKPFEPKELVARITSVIRRSFIQRDTDYSFEIAGLHFFPNKYEITYHDKSMVMTKKEFSILNRLASNPGRVYSREQILDLEWDMSYDGDLRTVDAHIKNIREKLKSEGYNKEIIETVWGVGYKVIEDDKHID
ncbi:response regulator transcription factor [Salipaludibacillus agaradhaerens]|uniref:response regulator transcription factor n=1 Tax=Salipaludibacillus agaradhaerens TaxID=76935 RepID=UPI0009983300|nr:response regulator transcription factor [Salipaludibacillus agaradhaerens]